MSEGIGKFSQCVLLAAVVCLVSAGAARAQRAGTAAADEAEFGPVVRTYLGYLRAPSLSETSAEETNLGISSLNPPRLQVRSCSIS